jgi:hypothetical protein
MMKSMALLTTKGDYSAKVDDCRLYQILMSVLEHLYT